MLTATLLAARRSIFSGPEPFWEKLLLIVCCCAIFFAASVVIMLIGRWTGFTRPAKYQPSNDYYLITYVDQVTQKLSPQLVRSGLD